jgi:LacI family transcriptional regulator
VNTVSRALTGKRDVSAKTRERILVLAGQLGYTPNLLARSLLRGRSATIGLLVTDCTNPFYAVLIQAVEETLSRAGLGLLLATSTEDVEKERLAIAMLRERRIDGLLFTPVDVDAPHVHELLSGDLPVVLLGRRPAGYKGGFVGTDNVRGARLVAGHLLDQGHRRVAHLTREDAASSARERLIGYRKALVGRGIAFRRDLVHGVPPSVKGGGLAAEWLDARATRPTAVFAYNDAQAVGLMLALQDAGIELPAGLSVVGFDDIELASLVRPALTTVAQPTEEIGRLGAEMLIARIREGTRSRMILLPPN